MKVFRAIYGSEDLPSATGQPVQHPNRQFTPSEVVAMRKAYVANERVIDIAERFNTTPETVSKIVRFQAYKDVDGPQPHKVRKPLRGEYFEYKRETIAEKQGNRRPVDRPAPPKTFRKTKND